MLQPAPFLTHFTADDGYRFAVRVWDPPVKAGRVIVLHGIVSHGGWYLHSCRHLAACGFEVHALDRRGSGLNLAARGDVPHYRQWLSDVQSYLESLPAGVPTVLVGISWGGKLAAALSAGNLLDLAGVAMVCPGLFACQQASRLQRAILHAAGIAGLSNKRIAIPLRDPELFTNSPRWQAYIRDDPFTLRRITVRFARADLQLNHHARAAAEQMKAPVLLMLAGRERIVDNGRTREFFHRIAAPDKVCLEYPDAGHTLEFEPDPIQYLKDLSTWVARVTSAQAGQNPS